MLQTWLWISIDVMFLTFPWNWNVLTTWPIQSVLTEAPFLCARESKNPDKNVLTPLVWLVDLSRVSTSGAVLTRKPVCVP